MSGHIIKRLKSVIVVPKKSYSSKAFDHKEHTPKLQKLKLLSQFKRTFHSEDGNKNHKHDAGHDKHDTSHDQHPSGEQKWPSKKSLLRHADYKPLGENDDWGPLSHKHELMPMNNVRYWHQHRCEVCDKLFEHKHKQRGDQSSNYNRHICNVCGGTNGSRRV